MTLLNVDEEIRQMIENFTIPPKDRGDGCRLIRREDENKWDASIFFYEIEEVPFYQNIFHFWVRMFFCHTEDNWLGPLFNSAAPFIKHEEIDSKDFEIAYFKLLAERNIEPHFLEGRDYKNVRKDLYDRAFQKSYKMIDIPELTSFVAYSGNQYLAFFKHTVFNEQLMQLSINR